MRNTKKLLAVLLSALMVMSCFVGMTFTVAAEEPVDTTPTYMIDWTNMPASSQVASSNDTTIVSWDKGYLDTNFTGNTGDPFISFGVDNVTGKDMAYMVIKYKTTTINDAAQLMWGTTDGTQGFGSNNGAFRWNKKDEWDTMLVYDGLETGNGTWDGSNETVTASVPWANDERTLNGIRFDYYTYAYIGSMASSDGHGLDLAYIAFFATKESAEAFMAEQAVLEALTPTFTFPAVNGATSYWTTENSQKYLTSDTVFPLTATNVPTTLTATAGVIGSVSADGFGYTSGGATNWPTTSLAGDYLAGLPSKRVTVDAAWDAITFTGWFREVNFTSIESVGLRVGSTDILIPANASADNVYDVALLGDPANPVWYHPGLVTALNGSDARRFYIEIPTASIPDGDSEANVIIKAKDGTIYTMNSWGTFLLAKNVTVVDYDYVDEEGNEYDVADPSANGQELYVDGKNTGLITVNNNTGIWACSQYHVELDSSTLSSAASKTTNDVGAPYYFYVADAYGTPVKGAIILLKNQFGVVTRAETNADGMAVAYTSSELAVSYEVSGVGITTVEGTAVAGVFSSNNVEVEITAVDPAIDSAAVELGETISVHYYATVEGALEVTMAGKTTVLDAPVYNESTKLYDYVFTGILPQQMAENIAAVLKVDGEVVAEQAEFDLVAYMTAIYNNGEASDELKALAAAALEYGVAAQEYLDYEGAAIEVIADSGYEVAAASAEGYAKTENAQYIKAAGVRYDYGKNGLYFKLNVVDGMAVTLNGEAVTPVDGMVRIPLSVLELSDVYTLEVTVGETVGETVETIVYSVEIYAARMAANADANAALATALFTYGEAARAYVG